MDQLASGNALICGKYQFADRLMGRLGVGIPPVLDTITDGLTGRLGVGIPPVLDTISSGCLHNFILDRPLLSIVHVILADEPSITKPWYIPTFR